MVAACLDGRETRHIQSDTAIDVGKARRRAVTLALDGEFAVWCGLDDFDCSGDVLGAGGTNNACRLEIGLLEGPV